MNSGKRSCEKCGSVALVISAVNKKFYCTLCRECQTELPTREELMNWGMGWSEVAPVVEPEEVIEDQAPPVPYKIEGSCSFCATKGGLVLRMGKRLCLLCGHNQHTPGAEAKLIDLCLLCSQANQRTPDDEDTTSSEESYIDPGDRLDSVLAKERIKCANSDNTRGRILLGALDVINGDRQDMYGEPEDSFALIAQYWNVRLQNKLVTSLDAADVMALMVLFKYARQQHQHKRDNLKDMLGYIGLWDDEEERKIAPGAGGCDPYEVKA